MYVCKLYILYSSYITFTYFSHNILDSLLLFLLHWNEKLGRSFSLPHYIYVQCVTNKISLNLENMKL